MAEETFPGLFFLCVCVLVFVCLVFWVLVVVFFFFLRGGCEH